MHCQYNAYMLMEEFEWDENKNEANLAKHGITLDEAKEIFRGPVLQAVDDRRDYGETRIAAIGMADNIELYIVYTMRGEVRRMISARRARRDERRAYHEAYPG